MIVITIVGKRLSHLRLLGWMVLLCAGLLVTPIVAQETPPDTASLLLRAREHFTASRYRFALDDLNQALTLQADNPEARFLRAEVLLELNRLDEARAELDMLLAQNPENALALALQGYLTALGSEEARAGGLATINRAIALAPNAAYPYYVKALYDMLETNYADAVVSATATLERDDTFLLALNVRAGANVAQGRTDTALEDYARIIELQPTLAYPYVNRAVIYRTRRAYEQALAELAQAINQQADYSPAYLIRAFVHIQVGNASPNRTEYLAAYERALQDITTYVAVTHPDDVLPEVVQLKLQLETLIALPE